MRTMRLQKRKRKKRNKYKSNHNPSRKQLKHQELRVLPLELNRKRLQSLNPQLQAAREVGNLLRRNK